LRFLNVSNSFLPNAMHRTLAKLSAALFLAGASLVPVRAQVGPGGGIDDQINLVNTINTAVPFLRITPDGRSGGMGDVGIAISPDANAIYWNTAKLAFAETEMGVSLTYTPWLAQLVDDIYLAYLSGYKKLDDLNTLGVSLRYFSLGQIIFTDISGVETGQGRPNEFALDFGYSRKLSDNIGTGVNLKYVFSNLASGQVVNGVDIQPGMAFGADLSFYGQHDMEVGDADDLLRWGVTISNIGTKISYTRNAENRDFLPTNLGLGVGFTHAFDDFNTITLAGEINKLLVPTPDTVDANPQNGILDYKEQSIVSGMLTSFGDAPGGFNEELRELMFSVGLEYWYDNQFAVRAGYFNEHSTKGGRKYFTVGLGLRYNVFGLDFAYLVPSSNQRNPLDNTLRFTLSFDFNDIAGKQKEVGS
jgi:hypothetical protein